MTCSSQGGWSAVLEHCAASHHGNPYPSTQGVSLRSCHWGQSAKSSDIFSLPRVMSRNISQLWWGWVCMGCDGLWNRLTDHPANHLIRTFTAKKWATSTFIMCGASLSAPIVNIRRQRELDQFSHSRAFHYPAVPGAPPLLQSVRVGVEGVSTGSRTITATLCWRRFCVHDSSITRLHAARHPPQVWVQTALLFGCFFIGEKMATEMPSFVDRNSLALPTWFGALSSLKVISLKWKPMGSQQSDDYVQFGEKAVVLLLSWYLALPVCTFGIWFT